MARRQASHIRAALSRALPKLRIRRLARELGVVQRRRKLDVVALVYSLVLGFESGERRTLSGLRRAYFRATGTRLAPSSFHARFTAQLVELMAQLVSNAMASLSRGRPKRRDLFAPFTEVLTIDSTLIRLHEGLKDAYPSVWTNHTKASAKLGMVSNVVGRGPRTMMLTHGSQHDNHLLKPGPWVRGRLIVFDLGFYKAPLFNAIRDHGGFFLTKMRKHGNPVIVRSHRSVHAHLVGMKLRDAQELVGTETLDVDAVAGFYIKTPKIKHYKVTYRFVAVYNHEAEQWHRYVTNAPLSMLAAEHLTAVYAARWEIELLFRELKSRYRLDHMPSGNRFISEALIYAAVLSLVASRRLHRLLLQRTKLAPERLPFDRWAALVAGVGQELLDLALSSRIQPRREQRLLAYLRDEALDPNRRRVPLALRAQQGVYARA